MYPTLKEELQKEWDEAEQARYEGLITEQVRASLVGKQILQYDFLPLCFSSMSVYATWWWNVDAENIVDINDRLSEAKIQAL